MQPLLGAGLRRVGIATILVSISIGVLGIGYVPEERRFRNGRARCVRASADHDVDWTHEDLLSDSIHLTDDAQAGLVTDAHGGLTFLCPAAPPAAPLLIAVDRVGSPQALCPLAALLPDARGRAPPQFS